MPFGSPEPLPTRRSQAPTAVAPFKFLTDHRGELHQMRFKAKVDEENARIQKLRDFRAKPPKVLHQEAYKPELKPRSPLRPTDVHLHTELRHEERSVYDEKLREREAELAALAQVRQQQAEALERQQVRADRKTRQFKAQPVGAIL